MAPNYTNYRPDLSVLDPYGGSTGRYGGVDPAYAQRSSRIRTFFKKPRNYSKLAGLGYTLPNIGGLRLKDINTAQGRRTAIMGGPGNLVYGLAGPDARKKFMIGRDSSGRITLVRRGARPGTPGAPAAPATPTTPGIPQFPKDDEFSKYEKDNPWIASYLRALRDEGAAFDTKFKNEFEPNVSNALNAFANLGVNAADRYARAAATSVAANQAATNITPTEAAGATGSFDPIAVAARQAASRATGEAAAENNRMAATLSALGPANISQGLLANIQRGYSSISAEYTRKRLEDQMKLDQWIQDQETKRLDREVQQQYNLGVLNLRGQELTADIAESNRDAAREGQFTDAELADKGFIKVPTGKKMGPKSVAAVNRTAVTSTEGTRWYKPGGGSGSSSSGSNNGLTANQQQQLGSRLRDAYEGSSRDAMGNLTNQGPGYRSLPLPQQIEKIKAWVSQEVAAGNIPRDAATIARFISAAIPVLQVKDASGGAFVNSPRGSTATWGTRIARSILGGG